MSCPKEREIKNYVFCKHQKLMEFLNEILPIGDFVEWAALAMQTVYRKSLVAEPFKWDIYFLHDQHCNLTSLLLVYFCYHLVVVHSFLLLRPSNRRYHYKHGWILNELKNEWMSEWKIDFMIVFIDIQCQLSTTVNFKFDWRSCAPNSKENLSYPHTIIKR